MKSVLKVISLGKLWRSVELLLGEVGYFSRIINGWIKYIIHRFLITYFIILFIFQSAVLFNVKLNWNLLTVALVFQK